MTPERRSQHGQPGEVPSGWKIGPYRITGILGRGGMGAVYAAVRADDVYEKQVAIKLIQLGMDSEEARARFRQEQQILAELDHPGIAALIDAGTTEDGLPYLVMERIDGIPITRYCAAKKLSIPQRLDLFQRVCAAVYYAHQHLIVHRDLKPPNILVTPDGSPKLLDFGVAKLVHDEQSTTTRAAPDVMTPDYASPEQVRGDHVTTATDVYSLGAILYELLAGRKPFDLANLPAAEIERIICRTDTPRPSLASSSPSRVRGDLDNIVLMAMHKDPARRYESARELAEDVSRHLVGQPVQARTETFFYKTGKFARRHRLAVGTFAAVVITLATGAVVSAREASRADRRFQQVRQIANSFLFEFHDRIKTLPGSVEARALVARTALEYLNSLQQDSHDDASLEWDIANAYDKVGDVQGYPYSTNLGQTTAALESYRKALAIKLPLVVDSSPAEMRRSLSTTYYRLGDVQFFTGATQEAQESFQAGLRIAEKIGGEDADALDRLGYGHARLGQVKGARGDAPGALEAHRTSNEYYRRLAALEPSARNKNLLSESLQRTGYAQVWTGQLEQARETYQQAIESGEAAVKLDPANTSYMRDLALVYWSLGDLYGSPFHVNLNDPAAAAPCYRRAAELSQQMLDRHPRDAQARVTYSDVQRRIANLTRDNKTREALRVYRETLAVNDSLLADDRQNVEYRRDRGFNLQEIAYALYKLGNYPEAIRTQRAALAEQESSALADTARTQFRQDMIPTRLLLARMLIATGKSEEARHEVEAALSLAQMQQSISPNNLYSTRNLADCFEAMAGISDQESWRHKSLDAWSAWEAVHGSDPYTRYRKNRLQ